ncbi:MinD/ParA family ATP-binding protein [Undibacterium sp. SXout7W]|uniref:MinD/ParA family ATP-binding protein n=1 Tax=Undibacterium sp. SXout7W TaxID=3413049 RepID=UPI003BF1704D
MANFDQAEGLRRMLAGPKPRVLTFLSALKDEEKSGMLVNLGVSLARQGSQVLMIDTRASDDSIGAWMNARNDRTLLDVAKQQRTMSEAIKIVASGLSVTMLARHSITSTGLIAENSRQLSRVFDHLVSSSDLVVVDTDIDAEDSFPLSSLDDSEIVIQVSADPTRIKAAYGLIKRVSNRLGRRQYGILVSGASEKEARLIYTNMAQAASRYLAVPLHFVGYVPEDEHVRKAAHLGRSVIDAFPKACASMAFSRLAAQLATTARSTLCLKGVPELGVGLGI